MMHIIITLLLLFMSGIFYNGGPWPERELPDTRQEDIKRIQEDIAKDDCRVLEGTWNSGECDIPIEVLIRNDEAKKECLKNGGTWGRQGLSVKEQCNLPTADGGKTCTDSSQCEGPCFGKEVGATSGQCSSWTINKGCYAPMYNGVATGILCED